MKKYAKLIALLSIIFVAIGATILGVYLNSIEKGNNFKLDDYIVRSEGNGVTIVSYEGEDTSITISSKIGGKKLVSISAGAFTDTEVTRISFDDDAKDVKLADKCFAGSTKLEYVKLPDGLEYIPDYCFNGCTGLKSVGLPQNIKYIGNYAFYGCTSLTKDYEAESDGYRWLNIPQSVTEICDYAFYQCGALDAIRVSENLETIGNYSFRESGLQKIALYNKEGEYGIKTIGSYAFYKSYVGSESGLNELYLPKLTTIGSYAFASISNNFKYFRIAPSVTMIGDYAFSGSSSLNRVVFEQNEDSEEIGIGKYAFAYDINLIQVALADKVTTISDGMFMGCIKLLSAMDLVLSEKTEYIGDGALAFFNSTSTNTKTVDYYVKFRHTKEDGTTENILYNDNFTVEVLPEYYSGNTPTKKKHFIVLNNDNELISYVGRFSDDTNSYLEIDSKKVYTFKSLLNKPITAIKSYAFSGSAFTKLCIPAKTTVIEDNAFNGSMIEYFYFASSSASSNEEYLFEEDAFNGIKLSSLDAVRVYVIGRSNAGIVSDSNLQKALNDFDIEIEVSDEPN